MHKRFLLAAVGVAGIFGVFLYSILLFAFFLDSAECATFQPAPKRTAGPAIPALPGVDPSNSSVGFIRDEMIVHDTLLRFTTPLTQENVFTLYRQQLEAEEWSFVYRNTETDQLFMGNSQGCPFYGLDIMVKPAPSGSLVTIDPYTNFHTCTCE